MQGQNRRWPPAGAVTITMRPRTSSADSVPALSSVPPKITSPLTLRSAPPAATKSFGARKILPPTSIVDDEPMIAFAAEKLLQGLGYTVMSFESAEKFLNAFLTAPAGIDLLITDQTMPGMTGIELALRLREEGHALPILLMTGFSRHLRPELVEAVGPAAVVRKPFESIELARLVRELLDDRELAALRGLSETR